MLHPAQLHYMLSQYLLPSATEVPKHWTPTKEDAVHALTGGTYNTITGGMMTGDYFLPYGESMTLATYMEPYGLQWEILPVR